MENKNETQPNEVNTVPAAASSGKGKLLLPIVICAIVALLIVGGIVLHVLTASPKAVFKNTINNGYKYIDNALDDSQEYYDMFDIQKDAITFSADVKADVDLEDADDWAKDIKDMKFSGKAGFNISDKEMLLEGAINGQKEKATAKLYIEDEDVYIESNLLEKPVKLSSEEIGDSLDIDWDDISKVLDEATKDIDTNPETYKYLTKAVKNALIDSLDTEYMEKSKDEIEINGKDVKVSKYSYELKEKAVKKIVENMAEYLLDDDDFISKTAKATGQDKKDVKETLKNLKKSAKEIEIDKDDAITINVYTKGLLNKFVGLSIEGEDLNFIYTTDGKNKEIVMDDNDDKVVITIEEKGKKSYTAEVKYNKEKIAKIEVAEFSNEKIDLEYEITVDDDEYEGEIYFTQEKSKSKVSGDYKFVIKYEKESIGVEGSYAIESSKKLDGVDTKSAISSKEIDETKTKAKYDELKKNDPALGKIIDTMMDELDITSVTPVEPDKQEKDYYGFYTVGYEEGAVKKVLTKTEPTVVYVGSEFYSGEQATTFESLKALHGEMHFTSYYYSYISASYDDDYQAAVKGIQAQCADTTKACADYPAVVLVKDGKVQKVLKGNYSKDALKKVLTEFGLS